jgi:hypothetical protein
MMPTGVETREAASVERPSKQPRRKVMRQRDMLALATVSVLLFGLVLPGSDTAAQQKPLKEQLTGAWIIVSTDQTAPDGTKHQLFGPNPKGVLVLDASGQYVQIIVRPGRPKFKANNRQGGHS